LLKDGAFRLSPFEGFRVLGLKKWIPDKGVREQLRPREELDALYYEVRKRWIPDKGLME